MTAPARVKVVETSTVTDDVLEAVINDWQSRGFRLDHIDYVQGPQSRRPQMAFIFFVETDNAKPEAAG